MDKPFESFDNTTKFTSPVITEDELKLIDFYVCTNNEIYQATIKAIAEKRNECIENRIILAQHRKILTLTKLVEDLRSANSHIKQT